MFDTSPFNQPIGSWDVGNILDMSGMFKLSKFNRDISMWNIVNVAYLGGMFRGSRFNQNLDRWKKIRPELGEDIPDYVPINKWIEY